MSYDLRRTCRAEHVSKLKNKYVWGLGAMERMAGFGVDEPTEKQKSLVDEALYLRGRIIASYAQVEFLLADISVGPTSGRGYFRSNAERSLPYHHCTSA